MLLPWQRSISVGAASASPVACPARPGTAPSPATAKPRSWAVAQLYRGIWADVTGDDDLELYDYNTDPNETVNQAANAKYADVVTKLKAVLKQQYDPAEMN